MTKILQHRNWTFSEEKQLLRKKFIFIRQTITENYLEAFRNAENFKHPKLKNVSSLSVKLLSPYYNHYS